MKEGWEIKKLGEVCDVLNGLWIGKKEPFVNICVIRNTNFTKDCKLNLDNVAYIDVEEKQYLSRKLKVGDIIIEKSGGSDKQPVGRVVLFDIENGDFSFSNFTSTLRIKSDIHLNSNYLHKCLYAYYLKGETFKLQSKTTGLHNLDMKGYLRLSIPIPPLEEQVRIVEELDCLSGVIEKKKQQLKELDALSQSIFYEMFGNPVENDRGWEVKSIKDVAPNKVYRGEVPSINNKYWLLNLDMISSNTGEIIQKCYFDLEEIGNSTIVFNEDNVLYSKLRPYLNKVVVPNEIGYATSELIPLCPDKKVLNKIFLALLLRSSIFVEYISNKVAGAKMPRVSMGDFWTFPIILPPLSLQQEFASKIESIEKQKELIKKSIEEVETLFNSRMDYYFG